MDGSPEASWKVDPAIWLAIGCDIDVNLAFNYIAT